MYDDQIRQNEQARQQKCLATTMKGIKGVSTLDCEVGRDKVDIF